MGEMYIGVNNTPKKIKNMWIGVNGVPKKITKAWIGVEGVPKLFYNSITIAPPTNISVSSSGYVTWDAVENASDYRVKYKRDGTWIASGRTENTYYQISDFSSSVTQVQIIAFDNDNNTAYSDIYTINWITITFNAGSGTASPTSKVILAGTQIGPLASATRPGYTISYWQTSNGTRVTQTTVFNADTTLYAHWVLKLGTSSITSVTSSGYITWSAASNASYYVVQKYGSSSGVWYSSDETTSTSYSFSSFNSQNTKVRVIAYDNYGNSTTSSEYSVNWITVTFNGNGGTVGESSRSLISGEQIGPLPSASRSGYTFSRWARGSTSGSTVTQSTTFTSSTTVYAIWTKDTVYYTITLNASTNGGTGGGSYSRAEGTTFSLSSYSATKQSNGYSYAFKGWYTSATGGTKTTSTTVNSNKTFYAHFNSSGTLILQAPTNVRVSGKTVSWSAATGAVKYQVYKNGTADSSGPGATYSGSETTGTSYTFNNSAYMYKVWVVAYDAYGNTQSSSEVIV